MTTTTKATVPGRGALPRTGDAVATTNACRACMPLGASLAFAGIEGTVPFLHGGQGCATYIRRYLISHFNEPLDIASSSFGEAATVFGGEANLRQGIQNVVAGYVPAMIGVATTCLAETIGEDVPAMLRRLQGSSQALPPLVSVSTPSYAGTHADGYRAAVAAVLAALAQDGPRQDRLALLPGMVSAADLRHLREITAAFGLATTMLPDYSDSLDAPAFAEYPKLHIGGTPLADIAACGSARACISLGGLVTPGVACGGDLLAERFGVEHTPLALPVGVRLTDAFVDALARLSGDRVPWLEAERGRLVDALVDGHKYVAGRRVAVVGDEDLVLGLTSFLSEIGLSVVLAASGGRSGRLRESVTQTAPRLPDDLVVLEDAGFDAIDAAAEQTGAQMLVGHSKAYPTARRLGIPLVRVGLPIHDRLGGQRLLHVGYRGAQRLFDQIVNTVIEQAQDASPVGYAYM